ncbi:hypothetical protein BLNAU_17264 [Blattamonas nauphoetae]|uniref:Homeobox domain-containing protein n=1 Tax=Blattamonas nauphoetae TaxID=2049346 RepID=A0ABQ9XAF6_9EUKA|nr:hypothetical protein BLNAU_17264 [Blattamonas nauphoetae]
MKERSNQLSGMDKKPCREVRMAVQPRPRCNFAPYQRTILKDFVDTAGHTSPSTAEKAQLAAATGLTVSQISNWFGLLRLRSKQQKRPKYMVSRSTDAKNTTPTCSQTSASPFPVQIPQQGHFGLLTHVSEILVDKEITVLPQPSEIPLSYQHPTILPPIFRAVNASSLTFPVLPTDTIHYFPAPNTPPAPVADNVSGITPPAFATDEDRLFWLLNSAAGGARTGWDGSRRVTASARSNQQVSLHTNILPFDTRSQHEESQHPINAKSLPKRQHPHPKSKSSQISGVSIKVSLPIRRKTMQSSPIFTPNRTVQDEASSANKVTRRNMHTLRQQESIASNQSASPTTILPDQLPPGYIDISFPFLNWRRNEPVAADRVSPLFVSLVSLVRDNVPFNVSLLRKVTAFFLVLDPAVNLDLLVKDFKNTTGQDCTDPVPLFVDSILVLLSSSHNSIVGNVLAFLRRFVKSCSASIRSDLLNCNLIPRILSKHVVKILSVLGDQLILRNLLKFLELFTKITSPIATRFNSFSPGTGHLSLQNLVLHTLWIPMEPALVQISRNPCILEWNEECADTLNLLSRILDVGACHQPTLDFVCSSRIPIVLLSLLTEVENEDTHPDILWILSLNIHNWQTAGAETMRRGTILQRMLEREGFGDGLEQKVLHEKSTRDGKSVRVYSFGIMDQLGMNFPKPR